MLRYKITLIVFFVLLILVFLLNFLYSISLLFLILPILFLLTVLITASFVINSQFYIRTICNISNSNNEIALTFDDGPEKENTPAILEVLKKYHIFATFFCIGEKINKNPEILLQTHQAGHQIGNHTFTHDFWFDLFSTRKMIGEIEKTNIRIMEITGEKPLFFRPPYGVTTPTMKRALKKFNLLSIGWGVRSLDTVTKSKKKVQNRVLSKIKSGDIIVFHDSVTNTPDILNNLIPAITGKGYKIVRLDQLINHNQI